MANSDKKSRKKTQKSRPQATTALSQPALQDASSTFSLSSFSPSGDFFAIVSRAVDKHRLRVFDVNTSLAVSEHIFEGARVTAMSWISLDNSDDQASSPKKKRKKAKVSATKDTASVQSLALGLSDGKVQIYSAVQGVVLQTLSDSSCKSEVHAFAKTEHVEKDTREHHLWVSYGDATLRLWNLRSGEILARCQNDSEKSYTALAIRPGGEEAEPSPLLAAAYNIELLSNSIDADSSDASGGADTVKPSCTFGGHASQARHLQWCAHPSPSKRFVSSAEADRFVHIWDVPDSESKHGKLAASLSMDADIQEISVLSQSSNNTLLALSVASKIVLSPIPDELSTSSKSSSTQIPTLLPRTTISLSKKPASNTHIVSATFRPSEKSILAALLSNGVHVSFERITFLDESGDFVPEISIQDKGPLLQTANANSSKQANHRYQESSSLAVGTGEQTGYDQTMDEALDKEVDGALDVNLADMSLGDRLAARSDGAGLRTSGSEEESSTKKKRPEQFTVPAQSLSRTLIQALHSSDTRLLESCLLHSDEALIRNTVQSLPPQLAVPLITACVDRLGRGGRSNNMKGRGGGPSAQRGMGLIAWVKAVLTIHSGHLLTIPDLVARLAALHTTLTTRLTLQERLLTLNGRLDLVLSQVELRSSTAPAQIAARKPKSKKRGKLASMEPTKYVEGESTDEEAGMDVEIEEDDDDDGSVEDVQLGEDSSGEEDEEEGSEDDEEDDEDDSDANLPNGFIDDEAEEEYSEDESEEDSE
ncbi:NUC189-domain-containing protein [Schizopora paradoxa]|uniref:NUC189-domain-containing protein n=1 Tax=Schizopora paradoxa TaxID=27342 RepID=A0A0H2R865_9AGAM|nr:NUC189-domain-containing protein [Schizopora paradoxa]